MASGNTFISWVGGQLKLLTASLLGGAGNANTIPQLNASGQLDLTMMPNGIGPNTAVIAASEAIAAGALVNVYTNAGAVAVRNADNSNTAKSANGFVLAAFASAANATVYLTGQITGLTGLTPGATYYLGTVGTPILAANLPTTTGTLLQQVGVALSATILEFAPQAAVAQ
jgi:hypothetical protein